jgi:hypothetical protein
MNSFRTYVLLIFCFFGCVGEVDAPSLSNSPDSVEISFIDNLIPYGRSPSALIERKRTGFTRDQSTVRFEKPNPHHKAHLYFRRFVTVTAALVFLLFIYDFLKYLVLSIKKYKAKKKF